MKKSLKYNMAAYGMVGLVLLTGCSGVDESSDVTLDTTKRDDVVTEKKMDIIPPQEKDQETEMGDARDITLNIPYGSPAGDHEFSVEMTVIGGTITAASAAVEPNLTHPAVIKWQGAFVENFESVVKGKSLEELREIDAIGGASLTTNGFKDAIVNL